ncbi:MAG: hypothetical protein JWQ08_2960 [Deinococcus sp.]|nr:hypothetical protein [Deinococcus sp.]
MSSASAVSVAPSNAAKLREFHRAMGMTVSSVPTVPSAELLALRRTLISEEWAEVQQEFGTLQTRSEATADLTPLDLTSLAHELADLLYVTYGALDALGLDADAIFAEVHRANLTKTTGPKRADGKQLKPEGWQPANVRAVIEGQLREQKV